MQKALSADKDIADLISDFNEISSSFGKETKSGIHGSSGLAKAYKGGNTVTNIPVGLEPYKSFIQHSENYKWVKWQLGGGCKKFCVNGQLAGNCCTPMELQINDRNERTDRQPAG
jgi:hypothetical protein